MPFEGVETLSPQPPVRLEPCVDFDQRLRAQLVPPALGVGSDPHQPGLTQHLEVFGGTGLAQAEPIGELTDQTRTLQQQIQDPPPGRLGDHVEGGEHAPNIPGQLYVRNSMYGGSAISSWTGLDAWVSNLETVVDARLTAWTCMPLPGALFVPNPPFECRSDVTGET